MRQVRGVASLVLLAGCASDVLYRMPASVPGETGTLTVRFTEPLQGVVVTVNGHLVAEGAHTERIVVERVPVGPAIVKITTSSYPRDALDKAETVDVKAGDGVAISLVAPPLSTTYWVVNVVVLIVLFGGGFGFGRG